MNDYTLGNPELDDLVSQLNKLGKHQYAQVVSAATKSRNDGKPRQAVVQIVNDDIQSNLLDTGWQISCPECGSTDFIKNGTRNGLQRFKCRERRHRFTTTSGTLLEKSNYMWDIWVKVVHDLINDIGINRTVKSLHDDYGCLRIHKETVWQMRMKILYAVWTLPSPTLHGTIQMDDTFFREGQKGQVELVNPLPRSANVERKPRYGVQPSLLGTLGPEFASTTCAVDNTGHCVVRSLSMGVPTAKQIEHFVGDHMEGIAFICSDDDKTYRKAIRSLSLPHYICPSTRLSVLQEAGHTQLSKDPEKAAMEAEDKKLEAAAYVGVNYDEINENRTVLSQTMPRMMFAEPDEVEHPAVFITVKTTGKSYEQDEVIGFTAIDENGEVLMNKKFRPSFEELWYEKADNPTHIRPASVFGDDEIKPIDASAAEITRLLRDAKSVIGWNLHFQLDMLHACRVDVPLQHKFIDLGRALYTDPRKPNKNRRNSFDGKAQEKFANAVRVDLGEEYAAEKPLDDAVYIMRIWQATFGAKTEYDDVPF